jgi:uncharacterized OB-fold protein
VSGDGAVYTYTVVRHATHYAFAGQLPYVLAIIELAEGPRLVTALVGVEPDQVRVGQPVRVIFREVADGVTLPYFESAAGPEAKDSGSSGGLYTPSDPPSFGRRR